MQLWLWECACMCVRVCVCVCVCVCACTVLWKCTLCQACRLSKCHSWVMHISLYSRWILHFTHQWFSFFDVTKSQNHVSTGTFYLFFLYVLLNGAVSTAGQEKEAKPETTVQEGVSTFETWQQTFFFQPHLREQKGIFDEMLGQLTTCKPKQTLFLILILSRAFVPEREVSSCSMKKCKV